MARSALILFGTLLVLVAVFPARAYLTEPREVVASTPSDYTGTTVPLPLPARGTACANKILYDAHSRIARFGATALGSAPGPALEIEARGNVDGPYRNDYRAVARVPGGWHGTRQFDVRLQPPRADALGTFCVRNLEDRRIDLVGSDDGRAAARPEVVLNGQATPVELQLRLLDAGRSSYLARAGSIMAHASTLRPFGAWWWWLLTIACGVLTPLGVALAMRTALTADAAIEAARPRAPAEPWLSDRARARLAAIPGWAIVAAVVAIAFVWLAYWGYNTHAFQNDEDQYVYLSRWLQAHFPESLWNFDVYQRGFQRLEVWLLAVPSALTDSPGSLIGGRLLNTLVFVSTAIPVYLLGRRMGLRSQWAALPAALSVLVPWAVVTTSFLTENVAYPACMWIVWAVWRAATAPSPTHDATALALLVVGGLSRTALLLLAPVLPVVVLMTGLRCGSGGVGARLRAVLRAHAVLWAAVAVSVLALLLAPLGLDPTGGVTTRLAGVYGTPFRFDTFKLLEKIGGFFARAVIGTGFFAAAVALPWLVIGLVRSRDPRRFAFALTSLGVGAVVLYGVNSASFDERYIIYLAPLLFLGATLAIARREISPLGLGVTAVLLALLVLRVRWNGDQGDFGFFVSPVEMFYARALGLRLDRYLPGDVGTVLTLVPLAFATIGVTLAVTLYRAPGRLAGRPAAVMIGAVVAAVLVQAQYTMTKYVNGAGAKSGPSISARAFVDQTVPAGATVGELSEGTGKRAPFFPLWQEVQFYNERISTVVSMGPNTNAVPSGDDLIDNVSYDARTGRIRSSRPLPDYLAIPTFVGTERIRGDVVASPAYVAVALVRVQKPATLAWRTSGLDPDGVVSNAGATVRVYGTGLAPGAHCTTLDLGAPAGGGAAAWRVDRDGRKVGSGSIPAGAIARSRIDLPSLAKQNFVDLQIHGRPQVLAVYVDKFC